MCYLETLLEQRNLAVRHFATLIGLNTRGPVDWYIRGNTVKPENREKIERGIKVLEVYDVVCPELGYGRNYESMRKRTWGDLNAGYLRYTWATCEYDEGFREIFESLE